MVKISLSARSIRKARSQSRGVLIACAGMLALAGCQWLDRVGPQVGSVFDGLVPADEENGAESPRAHFDRSAIRRTQLRLKKLGYGPGAADGIVGRRTVMAIRKYERAHRLPVTGRMSRRLVKHLAEGRSRSFDPEAGTVLAPGDLPAYRTWTTFVYSDGRVDRVVGLKGAFVRWARDNGTSFTAHRNFLLPWSYWSSVGKRGTARVDGEPGDLWPLAAGETVSFSTWGTVRYGGDAEPVEERIERWRCRNDGRRKLTVKAGTFDTVVFTCARRRGAATPELVRTWYYAPAIRHYVRTVDRYPDQEVKTRVDLVGVRPGAPGWPPIARAALERAVVRALSTAKDGATTTWTSSGVDTKVTIQPTRRFVGPGDRQCRAFVQIWAGKGRHARFPAIACRNAAGDWEIPGLGGNFDRALAVSAEIS